MVNTFSTIRSSRSVLWIWELECANRHHTNRSPTVLRRDWNFAITHAADLLRRRALKASYPHPAFGEMVGVWTSQDKKKTKALDPKGSVEILTTDEEGDSVIVKGLKPLRAEPDMVKLSQPVAIPLGWSDLAVQALASLWTVIADPLRLERYREHLTT
eukprot:6491841-Amphidinium_carterae.3